MGAREQILNAADQLFGKTGFDATTTREIAELSGVNKALIHYHFKSKEGLFESVLDSYYQRLNELLLKELQRDLPMRGRMWRIIDVYVDFLADNINFSRIVQHESSCGPRVGRISDHLLPVFKAGVEAVEHAYPQMKEGTMAAHHLILSFYGMIVSWFTYSGVIEGLVGEDPLSQKELSERKMHLKAMLDVVLDSVESKAQGMELRTKAGRTV